MDQTDGVCVPELCTPSLASFSGPALTGNRCRTRDLCVLLMKAQDCFTVRNTTKGGRGCFQSRIVCLDFPGSSVVLAGYFAASAQLHCLLLFCYGLALPGYEGSSVEPQLQIYDTSVLQVTKIKLWKKLSLAKCSRVCPIYCCQNFLKKSL